MRLLDITLPTPAENLAFDEALLVASEEPILRFWEPAATFAVLGRSSRHREELRLAACHEADLPITRRVSGGAAILAGPGCLMYAVAVDATRGSRLADLHNAHRYVLDRMVAALRPAEPSIAVSGTSDLTVQRGDARRKVSGNSLRIAGGRLLYHGTLLYRFPLPDVDRFLGVAPRQPAYRRQRGHGLFVTNLGIDAESIKSMIATEWCAAPGGPSAALIAATNRLASGKYSDSEWVTSR